MELTVAIEKLSTNEIFINVFVLCKCLFLLPYEAFIGFVRFKFGFSLSVLSFSLGVNRSWVGEEGDWE